MTIDLTKANIFAMPSALQDQWSEWINRAHAEGLDLTTEPEFVALHERMHALAARSAERHAEADQKLIDPRVPTSPLPVGYVQATDAIPFGHEGGHYLTDTLCFNQPGDDGEYGPCHRTDRLPQVKDLRGTVTIREPRVWPRKVQHVTFPALSPFAQSYVDGLMDDLLYFQEAVSYVSFGMFNPYTLLRVINDCNLAEAEYLKHGIEPCGLTFWVDRLNGWLPECEHFAPFRPLTPMLTSGTRSTTSPACRIIFALPLPSRVAN